MKRWLALAFTVAGITSVVHADHRLTVEQLEDVVARMHGKSDAECARRLSELSLSERLSPRRFAILSGRLPGESCRNSLLAISDESQFLNAPASEALTKPVPSVSEQRSIMGLVVAYVSRTIHQLPNFLATRTTTRFVDMPQRKADYANKYEPLHSVGAVSVQVAYQDGREVTENATSGRKDQALPERGLSTWGEFGPILSTVLLDAAQNKLYWSRWEQEESGPLAVFSFSVPREKSHYELDYCCVPDSEQRLRVFHELAGYNGEIAVDPATGTILRLKLQANIPAGKPVDSASLLVVYGAVEIGGKTYICPLRSIARSRARSLTQERVEMVQAGAHGQQGYGLAPVLVGTSADVTEQTLLNDITFTQYHVFRSESRVLTEANSDLSPLLAAPTRPELSEPVSSATALQGLPTTSTVSSAASAPTTSAVVPPTAPDAVAQSASITWTPVATNASEITTTTFTELPDHTAASQPPVPNTAFTLRTVSRLVEVTAVAFDKKGHPITDLKPTDFEIYDNGHKQIVNSFTQSRAETSLAPPARPITPNSGPAQQTFANRPVNRSSMPFASPQLVSTNTTVFLIDSSHVAFADLSYARSEMLRFLKTVPADEAVGLYALRKYGFEILEEPTTDHDLLSATLRKWIPSAQDLAQAQSEEQRNRQQMEYVRSVGDLLSVNGNASTGEADAFFAPDPQRRSLGDNPPRDALAFLSWIARHLAVFPGHKSLIWVSSDNVLADFSEKAPNVEKGDKYLEPLSLRTRETLNEGHISIYPLDASQLEPGGVSASFQHGNVQLNPTVNETVQLQQLPPSLRQEAQEASEKSKHDINPGRLTTQMQQDTHPIQGAFRELAEATGGRALRRASDIAAELESIVNDGRAAYTLSFTPDTPADGTYHHLTVKVATRRDITIRYRTGYFYLQEPATLKERFQNAVWRPADQSEIALVATTSYDAKPASLKINIAATDLALAQQAGLWVDKLDIFLIQRDDAMLHAKLDGRTLGLRLKPTTYQQVLKDGISIDEPIKSLPSTGALRIVVVDENTGRIGTLTIPSSALGEKR